MTEGFRSRLLSGTDKLGICISDFQASQLFKFYYLIIEKNKVMNLTSITNEEDFISKHLIDSLSIVSCLDLRERNLRVIDIGTGAGFPGMVLKIVFPQLDIILFDSLKKRLVFLDDVINILGLDNISTVHGRAEDFGHHKAFRENFDLSVSRAVASLPVLLEYCLPFVRQGGVFVAYKSSGCSDELKASGSAMSLLGGRLAMNKHIILPDTDIERCFILVNKYKYTPSCYPRKAGKPSASPL